MTENMTASTQDWRRASEGMTLTAFVDVPLSQTLIAGLLPDMAPTTFDREDFFAALGLASVPHPTDVQTLWDKQLEEDVKAGRLDKLGQRALEAYEKGEYTKR